jgi:hypothetical protein
MISVTLLKFLWVLALVSLIAGVVRIVHLIRGRAMRAFAERLGFEYIGPGAPPNWLWNPTRFDTHAPLPSWISHLRPCGQRIRQVWNVTQGNRNGIPVLIFDSVIGEYKGGQPCTVIACQTEENPFITVTSADRILSTHGWTVLHGSWFLWFSWTMGVKRLDAHLNELKAVRRT